MLVPSPDGHIHNPGSSVRTGCAHRATRRRCGYHLQRNSPAYRQQGMSSANNGAQFCGNADPDTAGPRQRNYLPSIWRRIGPTEVARSLVFPLKLGRRYQGVEAGPLLKTDSHRESVCLNGPTRGPTKPSKATAVHRFCSPPRCALTAVGPRPRPVTLRER
jgi:hypothetical protein